MNTLEPKDESKSRRAISITIFVSCILVLLAVVYAASAAPVTVLTGEIHGAYRPVKWLTKNTCLRSPMLWWAGVCDTYLLSPKTREIEENLGL